MKPLHLAGFALGAGLGVLAACFTAPPLAGPYLCDQGNCADPELTCVNGLCCNLAGEPACEGGGGGDGGDDGGSDDGGGSDGGGGADGGPDAGSCVFPGPDCNVDGAQGVCVPGRYTCDGGLPYCVSLVGPSAELCNGLDDNCDGYVDNAPRCPPPSFTNLPPDAGFTVGAERTVAGPTNASTTCLKGLGGNVIEFFSGDRWTGSGAYNHIAWAEVDGNGTWDLTRANLRLGLRFSGTATDLSVATAFQFYQPQVLLCGEFGTMARLGPFYSNQISVDGGTISVDTLVHITSTATSPYRSEYDNGLDLANVRRIEVLIAPAPNNTNPPPPPPPPAFDVTFSRFGFLP